MQPKTEAAFFALTLGKNTGQQKTQVSRKNNKIPISCQLRINFLTATKIKLQLFFKKSSHNLFEQKLQFES